MAWKINLSEILESRVELLSLVVRINTFIMVSMTTTTLGKLWWCPTKEGITHRWPRIMEVDSLAGNDWSHTAPEISKNVAEKYVKIPPYFFCSSIWPRRYRDFSQFVEQKTKKYLATNQCVSSKKKCDFSLQHIFIWISTPVCDGCFLLMTPHINEMSNIMWWQIEKKREREKPFCVVLPNSTSGGRYYNH